MWSSSPDSRSGSGPWVPWAHPTESPWRKSRKRLRAAVAAASSVKLRTQFGKLTQEMRQVKDYSPQVLETKIAEKLHESHTA